MPSVRAVPEPFNLLHTPLTPSSTTWNENKDKTHDNIKTAYGRQYWRHTLQVLPSNPNFFDTPLFYVASVAHESRTFLEMNMENANDRCIRECT